MQHDTRGMHFKMTTNDKVILPYVISPFLEMVGLSNCIYKDSTKQNQRNPTGCHALAPKYSARSDTSHLTPDTLITLTCICFMQPHSISILHDFSSSQNISFWTYLSIPVTETWQVLFSVAVQLGTVLLLSFYNFHMYT